MICRNKASWFLLFLPSHANAKFLHLPLYTKTRGNSRTKQKIIKNFFNIERKLTLTPFNIDEGWIIKGKDGGVLFSVLDDVSSAVGGNNASLKWLSFLFAFLALYSYFYIRRTFTAFFLFVLGITALRCITFIYGEMLRLDNPLFSPNLYADTGLFSSLGNLLLNNLYVALILIAVYIIRKRIISGIEMTTTAAIMAGMLSRP